MFLNIINDSKPSTEEGTTQHTTTQHKEFSCLTLD